MRSLKGWVIALGPPKTLLGKSSADGSCLSPVYELEAGIAQDPNGQTGIAHRCAPICWLPSADSVERPDGITIEVDSLSKADQETLGRAVDAVEQIVANLRAAQAGIVLAPAQAMPKGKVH